MWEEKMSNQLATRPNGNALAINGYEREQIDLIKKTVAPDATDTELQLFLYTCKTRGFDPLLKQAYFIKRGGKGTIQVSIDGFRMKAAETRECAGIDDAEFVGGMTDTKNFAARVTVWRMVQGVRCPFTATARWSEYVQSYNGKPSGLWEKMPHTMLAKCAESLALRKAFPAELGELYTNEEMTQADNRTVDRVTGEIIEQRTQVQSRRPKDPDPDAMKHERLDGEKIHGPTIDPATNRPVAPQYRKEGEPENPHYAPRSTEEDAVLGKHLAWLGGWMTNKKLDKTDRELAIYLLNAVGNPIADHQWTSRKQLTEEDWALCKKTLLGLKTITLNAMVQAYVEAKNDNGDSPFSDEHVPPGIEPCPACGRKDLNCLCTPEEVAQARADAEGAALSGTLIDVDQPSGNLGAFSR